VADFRIRKGEKIMADFCKQCSEKTFGKDFGDLAGITTKEDWEKGLAATVLCEGCGVIKVDPEGNCISVDCYESHGEKK
jgi:hypothetical protein